MSRQQRPQHSRAATVGQKGRRSYPFSIQREDEKENFVALRSVVATSMDEVDDENENEDFLRACTTNKCNDNEDNDDDDDENRCFASLGYLEEEYEAGGEKDSSLLQFLKTSGFGNVSPIAPRNNMNKNNNDTTMHTWSSESNDEFGFHSLAVPAALARENSTNDFLHLFGDYEKTHKDVLDAIENERSVIDQMQLILTQSEPPPQTTTEQTNDGVLAPPAMSQMENVVTKRRPGRPRKIRPLVDEDNKNKSTRKKRKKGSEDNDNDELLVETRKGNLSPDLDMQLLHNSGSSLNAADINKNNKNKSISRELKKSARSTSRFRGVTHHCRTGRWEAHIWQDGKQIYLGGFDGEEQAALAYDIAAVKCRGVSAITNFNRSGYSREFANLQQVDEKELILSLRRQSKGGVMKKSSSKFRGVTKHQKGKWEARIGQLVGKKYKYLGLHDTEDAAAIAYDQEAVRLKGFDAITNFDISEYADVLAEHHASKMRDAVALKEKYLEMSTANLTMGSLNPSSLVTANTTERRMTTRSSAADTNNAQKRETTTTTASTKKQRKPVPHMLGPAAAATPSSDALNAVKALFNNKPQAQEEEQEEDNDDDDDDGDKKCDQDEHEDANEYGMDLMRQSRDM